MPRRPAEVRYGRLRAGILAGGLGVLSAASLVMQGYPVAGRALLFAGLRWGALGVLLASQILHPRRPAGELARLLAFGLLWQLWRLIPRVWAWGWEPAWDATSAVVLRHPELLVLGIFPSLGARMLAKSRRRGAGQPALAIAGLALGCGLLGACEQASRLPEGVQLDVPWIWGAGYWYLLLGALLPWLLSQALRLRHGDAGRPLLVEFVWVVLPGLVLLGLASLTWGALQPWLFPLSAASAAVGFVWLGRRLSPDVSGTPARSC